MSARDELHGRAMSAADAARLVQLVDAARPGQGLGPAAAESWHELLGDLPFADCATVVRHLSRTDEGDINPGHIRERVEEIRAERLDRYVIPTPPGDVADNPGRYLEWLRDQRSSAASGIAQQAVHAHPRPFVDWRPTSRRQPAPRTTPEYEGARDHLLTLPDLGSALIAQAREELGPKAAYTELVIRAYERSRPNDADRRNRDER